MYLNNLQTMPTYGENGVELHQILEYFENIG